MNLNRTIQDLKAERDVLASAIECLERFSAGRVRKRGRPPAWMKRTAAQKCRYTAMQRVTVCRARQLPGTRNHREMLS